MGSAPLEHRNDVVLVGRVTTEPTERTLPSGDVVASWRLTIDRPGTPRRFDVVDCSAWSSRLRRSVAAWARDDVVEVTGALRRRFWRGGSGVASACDVEVSRARRVSPAGRPRTRE